MTDQQPDALRLADKTADLIHTLRRTPMPLADLIPHLQANADELRRLHSVVTECDQANHALHIREMDALQKVSDLKAINAQLLESLSEMVGMIDSGDEHGAGSPWHTKARAAIAAASDETSR